MKFKDLLSKKKINKIVFRILFIYFFFFSREERKKKSRLTDYYEIGRKGKEKEKEKEKYRVGGGWRRSCKALSLYRSKKSRTWFRVGCVGDEVKRGRRHTNVVDEEEEELKK